MARKLPSLNTLDCFEAVIRYGHVTRAAEALNLTQSAVSKQIRILEDYTRETLFHRKNRRLIATQAALDYAREIAPALDAIEHATQSLMKPANNNVIKIGVLPTFGSRWLIPVLGQFSRNHPHIQLNIITGLGPFDIASGAIDIAIQYGDGTWPDVTSHRFIEEEMIAVISPEQISDKKQQPSNKPQLASLTNHNWLTMQTRPDAWREWLEGHDLVHLTKETGTQFENFTLVLDAVHAGLGVAILPTLYVEEEIIQGKLSAPFGGPVPSKYAYYLVHSNHNRIDPNVILFRDWLFEIAEQSEH